MPPLTRLPSGYNRWRRGSTCGRGAAWALLFRHGLLLLRGGVLRWRLETFGLYMPSLPNRRPWWRPNIRAARLLLRQRGAYARWLREMRALTDDGAPGWWQARLGPAATQLHEYVQAESRDDGAAQTEVEG